MTGFLIIAGLFGLVCLGSLVANSRRRKPVSPQESLAAARIEKRAARSRWKNL